MVLKMEENKISEQWTWYVTADGVVFEWTGNLHK